MAAIMQTIAIVWIGVPKMVKSTCPGSKDCTRKDVHAVAELFARERLKKVRRADGADQEGELGRVRRRSGR